MRGVSRVELNRHQKAETAVRALVIVLVAPGRDLPARIEVVTDHHVRWKHEAAAPTPISHDGPAALVTPIR